MRLLSEILLVAMAVFGLYCLFRLWAAACFASGRVGAVVLLPDAAARGSLAELLREAARAPFRPRRVPVTVLYNASIFQDGTVFSPEEQALLREYGARCYPAAMTAGESGELPSDGEGNPVQKERESGPSDIP